MTSVELNCLAAFLSAFTFFSSNTLQVKPGTPSTERRGASFKHDTLNVNSSFTRTAIGVYSAR